MKDFWQLHRTIKLRLLMTFSGLLAYSTVGASMTIYYNKYLGAGITGLLLIVSSVLVFLVGLWGGHLSDRFGRRPLMMFSTLMIASGGAIAALANSPWLFSPWVTYVGFLVLNFGAGLFNTASSAMIVDITDSSNRKLVYGLQYWFINLAILIGSALSGWFFKDYLFELLLAIAIEEFISFGITFFFIPESFDPSKQEKKAESNIIKAYFAVAKDRSFMLFCLASVFIAMIFNQIDYYLPVHLSDSFRTTRLLGLEIYGQRMLTIFIILNTAIIVLFMNKVIQWTRDWSRRQGISIGIVLNASGMLLAFVGHSFLLEILASLIMTIGEMILVPVSQAFRADLMPADKAGTYSGAFAITQPIAAVLSGAMVSISAFIGNLGMAAFMFVVMICAIFFIRRSLAHRESMIK